MREWLPTGQPPLESLSGQVLLGANQGADREARERAFAADVAAQDWNGDDERGDGQPRQWTPECAAIQFSEEQLEGHRRTDRARDEDVGRHELLPQEPQ